jgi:hypothetical protein
MLQTGLVHRTELGTVRCALPCLEELLRSGADKESGDEKGHTVRTQLSEACAHFLVVLHVTVFAGSRA